MAPSEMTREKLLALLAAKASASPTGPNELLARHLKCKESRTLAEAVAYATQRYADPSDQQLQPPSELLPPLA